MEDRIRCCRKNMKGITVGIENTINVQITSFKRNIYKHSKERESMTRGLKKDQKRNVRRVMQR